MIRWAVREARILRRENGGLIAEVTKGRYDVDVVIDNEIREEGERRRGI